MANNYTYESEQLEFAGHLVCSEFYYTFVEDRDFLDDPTHVEIWASGLKKVFDFKDTTGNYTMEKAVEYLDDDQTMMLTVINGVIAASNPNAYVDYVYVNYLTNPDGSENLLKQILMVFQIGNSDLIIRVPLYAFTDFAKNQLFEAFLNGGL